MTKIIFVSHGGESSDIDAENGMSVMEAAVRNGVPGIDADCGGACACATCHVYIAPEWFDKVGQPLEMEMSMLELAEDVRPTSRLSCQIIVRPDFDGLVVETPEIQGGLA